MRNSHGEGEKESNGTNSGGRERGGRGRGRESERAVQIISEEKKALPKGGLSKRERGTKNTDKRVSEGCD